MTLLGRDDDVLTSTRAGAEPDPSPHVLTHTSHRTAVRATAHTHSHHTHDARATTRGHARGTSWGRAISLTTHSQCGVVTGLTKSVLLSLGVIVDK